ncbi:putative ATPase [Kribbella amoyensis]|uniref:Putative ATPase n=1 Tax=Kribbella amoyensis TaxID=996641 RepID=A0A561C0M4_9ACTN|nr:helix-turn-helix domain-containing protein [Kribbella amoyensis]TWD84472.1 putative ATPase [Kribbella amoyensis]
MDETFAALLRSRRLALGLTQERLAELAGVSPQAIGMLERGVRRFPQRTTLDKLGDAFELTPAERTAFEQIASRGRVPTDSTETPGPLWTAPLQLPGATPNFVGRDEHLDQLTGLLTNRSGPPGSPAIATIQGMPGVGKTSLALVVAHAVAARYPDGVVHLDLRGFGPGEPLAPSTALARVLESTGLPADELPARFEDLVTTFRTRFADRRVLLVLDNAAELGQVTPLIPASAGCGVLVTSRRTLTALQAGRHVHLDPLTPDDSVELFTSITGRDDHDPAVRRIAELCGHLPLAITIAAAWLVRRPAWSADDLALRLADESRRLDLLGTDDLDVRASVTFSIDQLTAGERPEDLAAADAFALLSLPDGPDLTAQTAAPLLGSSDAAADRVLEYLVDLHLLQSPHPGRYRFHDLVRTYARELADDLDPARRDSAFARYLTYYLAAGWRACELSDAGSARFAWSGPDWRSTGPAFTEAGAGLDWIDRELANILAVIDRTGQREDTAETTAGLLIGLFGYFTARGHLGEWLDAIDQMVHRPIAPWSRAQLQADAAIAATELARYDEASERFEAAAAGFEAVGDLRGQSMVANNHARLFTRRRLYDEALPYVERGLAINRKLDNDRGISFSLAGLAEIYGELGRHHEEVEYTKESLEYLERSGSTRHVANTLIDLGVAHARLGRTELGVDEARQGLRQLEALGQVGNCSDGQVWIGWILALAGRHREAVGSYEEGLSIAVELADRRREANARFRLGVSQLALGDRPEADLNLDFALGFYREHRPEVADDIEAILTGGPPAAAAFAARSTII